MPKKEQKDQLSIVEVTTSDNFYTGMLMPNSNKETVFLKLDSGYNIGISRKNIKKIVNKKKVFTKGNVKIKIQKNKGLPTVSILHTGGTIASKVSYETGAVFPQFTTEDLLEMFPEIKSLANIESRLVKNMWSQDMRFSHYNLLAKEVQKEIKKGVNGIIITHGTDTLHYTSAALAFVLENLPIPVMLVGSQRSSDRGSTDAALNLINAVYFMTKTDFAEVAVCMHESISDDFCSILPACKTRKMHASRRDAFKPINANAIARVNFKENKIHFLDDNYKKKSDSKLELKQFKENIKVAIIKQHTNMFAEQFSAYKDYHGLIIEATGLGNPPTTKTDESTKESEKILNAIKLLAKKMPIVLAPQTIYGRLNLNVYENQRVLQDIGILGHLNDMTPETTFIKLAWLLSNYKKDEIKDLITKNLRGEIRERILPNEELA